MTKQKGLVGITSELKLWRFGHIAKILFEFGGKLNSDIRLTISKEVKIRTEGTMERQFSIMKKLGLVEGVRDIQVLTGLGRSLAKIASTTSELNLDEKIFHFMLLFTSITKTQLLTLLKIISDNDGSPKREIIIKFFKTPLANSIWSTASKNVKELENKNHMSSFIINKFGCLSGWLNEVDLIDIVDDRIYVKTNPKVINYLGLDDARKQIVEIASSVYSLQTRKFNQQIDSSIFLDYFKNSYNFFSIRSGEFSNVRAIKNYCIIKLLTQEKIILDEECFDKQIEILASSKKIKSVMLGRDGKPAHVVM